MAGERASSSAAPDRWHCDKDQYIRERFEFHDIRIEKPIS
jgi:hypothetical protein